MENGYLEKNDRDRFLDTLRTFGELHGPTIAENGVAAFALLSDASPLRLDYRRTLIPPKKYLIPFREELLHCHDGSYRPVMPPDRDIILFGVHPCDLEAIAYLDRVFLGDPPDPCYAARRARLTLIGISCEPDDFCFCTAAPETAPCDLFLSAREDGFLVSAATPRGEAIVRAAGDLLTESAPGGPPPLAGVGAEAAPPHPPCGSGCGIPPQDPQLRFSENPLWDRFAQICVSCGACSVCCPTCYCFDVREYPGLSGDAVRLREWDNCLFKTHGEVAGGNFRATRLERLRFRFLHKYCGFSPLEGVSSCVGCGRCKEACPVDIDLRELFPYSPPGGDPS